MFFYWSRQNIISLIIWANTLKSNLENLWNKHEPIKKQTAENVSMKTRVTNPKRWISEQKRYNSKEFSMIENKKLNIDNFTKS